MRSFTKGRKAQTNKRYGKKLFTKSEKLREIYFMKESEI